MKNRSSFLLFLIFAVFSCNHNEGLNLSDDGDFPDTNGVSISAIDKLHTRLTVNTMDKSLVDYVNSKPVRPDSIRQVLYLLPFGNMKPEILDLIQNETAYLELFFQLKVTVLEAVSFEEIEKNEAIKTRFVPDSDFQHFDKVKGGAENLREQIEANSFIASYAEKNIPSDAIAVLGVTEHDIYSPKYNYLFGTSNATKRMGLVSTFRLVDYGENTKLNVRKVISKQLVNLFSIRNVKDYECLVNFHNNRFELEAGGFKLSPRVLEKLKFAIGFDYEKRFDELGLFWESENDSTLAAYYLECKGLVANQSGATSGN